MPNCFHPVGKGYGGVGWQILKTLPEELEKREKEKKENVLIRQIWRERRRNSEK